MRQFTNLCFVSLFLCASSAHATIFSQIHGIIHDPQHRPIACAHVEVKAANSAFSQTVTSGQDGSFSIASLPLGDYSVTVSETGFAASRQTLTHAF
jgi:hypothetical protein